MNRIRGLTAEAEVGQTYLGTIQVQADSGPTAGIFQLTTDQPAGRYLTLDMPSTPAVPPHYRCDFGPENPNKASNKSTARIGAKPNV